MLLIPNLSCTTFQTSGLKPFPYIPLILCCFSNSFFGADIRYLNSSPIYVITVTLYFAQSSQNFSTENFFLKTTVPPVNKVEPKPTTPPVA